MTADIDLPGFDNPVAGAQTAFRAVLGAMAVPGSIHAIAVPPAAPAPLSPASAAVLLTLVDADTPLSLDRDAAAARDWIGFHCGTRFTSPALARFALALTCPDLTAYHAGSDEAPEESCTIILHVAALGSGDAYRLSGPGLRAPMEFRAAGLPEDFAARWSANHAMFPRGVDMVLCAHRALAALPRSVRLEKI